MSRRNPSPELQPNQEGQTTADPVVIELNHYLDRWLQWYRLSRAATWTVRGLAISLAAGLATAWLLLWRSSILRPEYVKILLGFSLAGLILGASIAYLWPVARLSSARFFDRRLHLKERVSTALELAASQAEKSGATESTEALYNQQLNDALNAAKKADFRANLPIQFPKLSMVLALLLGIAVIASIPIAAPRFEAAGQQRAVQTAINTEAAQLEALVEKIQANPQLTTRQKESLTQPLQTAAQTLRRTNSLEESISALTQAQGDLQTLEDTQAGNLAQGLRQAGRELSNNAGSPLAQTGQQLAVGNIDQAAESLSEINPARLNPAQQAVLVNQLQELSDKLQGTDPSLNQQLGDAARRLQAGQAAEAQQAIQQAASSLAAAGEKLAQSDQAGQAAIQVQAGQQQLLQSAGIPGAYTAQNGSQAGSEGNGEGTGTSSQSGQGSGSSGAGRGENQGETGSGPEAGASPIGQSNGPGDGGLRPSDQVYAPQLLGGEGGPAVNLPESGQPGETASGSGTLPLGQSGQSQVPYTQVYQTYAQAYRQAIEHGQVPPSLRDVVRDYFSSLEP